MREPNDCVYIYHIRDAVALIEEYTKQYQQERFVAEQLVQDAVIRQLEIIGEATKRISRKTRDKYPNVPWNNMAGMRDKLIHDYMGVDSIMVWKTVVTHLPQLKESITELVIQCDQRTAE